MLAIDTVFSRNPRISLDFLAYGVLLAGLYLLLRALLAREELRTRLGATMLILAFALAVAYLLAVGLRLGHLVARPRAAGRPAAPAVLRGPHVRQPGARGGDVGARVDLGDGASRLGDPHTGSPWSCCGSLTVAVVIVSGTRGAWVALAAMAFVAAMLAPGRIASRLEAVLATTPGRVAAGGRHRRIGAGSSSGPSSPTGSVISSDGGRVSYWSAALRMFTDAPLTGVGPGMWAPQRILHTAVGELDYYIPHAHNVFLQTAAESGLIGLASGVVVLVTVGRLVWATLRAQAGRERWAIAAILTAVYFAPTSCSTCS